MRERTPKRPWSARQALASVIIAGLIGAAAAVSAPVWLPRACDLVSNPVGPPTALHFPLVRSRGQFDANIAASMDPSAPVSETVSWLRARGFTCRPTSDGAFCEVVKVWWGSCAPFNDVWRISITADEQGNVSSVRSNFGIVGL